MAEIATVASLALSAASTVVGFMGAQQAAAAAEADANFRAKQMEQRANEERAVGQRNMFEQRRKADLAQSTLRARAAAATGDTTDTGVLNLDAGIEREGEYRALTEFYKGENSGRGYEDAAAGTRASGKARADGYRIRGIGTLLEGATSFADKYSKAYG